MLAGARLGDDAGLAETLGEQCLAEHVVDLVRAGVVEVLALEEHAGAAGVLGEPGDLGDGRRPAGVGVQQAHELRLEGRIRLRGLVLGGQLVDRGDERLRHVAPAEFAEERTGCFAKAHGNSLRSPRGSRDPASKNACSVVIGSLVTSASPISTTSAPAAR